MRVKKIGKYHVKSNKKSWRRAVKGLAFQRIDSEQTFLPESLAKKIIFFLSEVKIYKIFKTKNISISFDHDFDLLIDNGKEKIVAFDFSKNIIIKKYRDNELFDKNYKIRNIVEVKELSPLIIEWNYENCSYREELVKGKRLNKGNIIKGKKVIQELWPKLFTLHKNYSFKKSIDFANENVIPNTKEILKSLGISNWWQESKEVNAEFGFVHGDLKQSNIIISDNQAIVIDWDEYFQKALIFTDIFYYLYRLTLRVNAKKVFNIYFDNKDWLLKPLNYYDKSLMRRNLVYFIYWLNNRYNSKKRFKEREKMINFIKESKMIFEL